ncbi:MAG TPA: polysaccharide deacetylase family protein [Fimbriimonadaceae bacterium]|nr:polysaccharide deacetylase family protein [Fimbriimonadaceae bacterium]
MSEPIGSMGWPGGAKAAISLTYDGGLPDHLFLAEPLLRVLGFPATFYLSATFFLENPRAWAAMANQGHEIGNHSLFGVTGPNGELPNWTLEMVDTDLQMTESLLSSNLPGPKERSFAYPGTHPVTAEGSYESVVEQYFSWARTLHQGLNHAIFCNPRALRAVSSFDISGAGLVQKSEEALDLGAWAIFVFEGIGAGKSSCGERDHEILLRHLAARGEDLYVAPVREVAQYVVEARERMTVR